MDEGQSLSVDTVTAYLKRKFPKANAERILGKESEYDYKRQVRKPPKKISEKQKYIHRTSAS